MLKHSVQIELFPILWVTKLIYSESPMYPVLDKDTIKNEILPHLSKAKRGYVSKLPHRGCKRHLVQVEDRLPMGTPSCGSLVQRQGTKPWCRVSPLQQMEQVGRVEIHVGQVA